MLTTSRMASATLRTRRELMNRQLAKGGDASAEQLAGSKFACDFFDLIGFQLVAFFDVVKPSELDTAFHAALDFANVIFFATQRFQWIIAHDTAVANDADSAISLDLTAHHAATGDRSGATNGKGPQDHGHADFHDLLIGFEAAFERRLDIIGDLVNDFVATNLDLDFVGQAAPDRRGRR